MPSLNNSKLYKRLKEATREEDHANLLAQLELVEARYWGPKVNRNAPSLASAFVWDTTPQKFKFWHAYAKKLKDEGWRDVAGI